MDFIVSRTFSSLYIILDIAWLLISGIRPPSWQPIVVNSLIETNLGMPFIYYIHKRVTKQRNKGLSAGP